MYILAEIVKILFAYLVGTLVTLFATSKYGAAAFRALVIHLWYTKDNGGGGYKVRLGWIIKKVDNLFVYSPDKKNPYNIFAFLSLRSFLIFFALALLYPISFISISWVASGNSSLGTIDIFQDQPNPLFRTIQAAALLMSIIFWWYFILEDVTHKSSMPKWLVALTGFFFGALSMSSAALGAVSAVVAGAFAPVVIHMVRRNHYSSIIYILFFGAGLSTTISSTITTVSSYILFLVFLPFFNAFFDWASFGITRLIMSGLQGSTSLIQIIIFTIFELIISVVCVLGMVICLVGALVMLPFFAPGISTDWEGFALENPLAIQLMLATSLLPTALHLIVVSLAVSQIVSTQITRIFFPECDTCDQQGKAETLICCIYFALCVFLALLGLNLLIFLYEWAKSPEVGEYLKNLATTVESYALS